MKPAAATAGTAYMLKPIFGEVLLSEGNNPAAGGLGGLSAGFGARPSSEARVPSPTRTAGDGHSS